MTTYQDNGLRYFYDVHVRMWTLYKIDNEGNQVGHAEYFGNKGQLKANYPYLKFIAISNVIIKLL